MVEWLHAHPALTGWMLAASIVLFVVGIVVMPVLLIRMRPDHFLSPRAPAESFRRRHPVIRYGMRVLKNLVGAFLLVVGLAGLALPGPGIITIVVALTLLEFPGKRRLELRIIGQRPVLHGINWIRAQARKPPLLLPERGDPAP